MAAEGANQCPVRQREQVSFQTMEDGGNGYFTPGTEFFQVLANFPWQARALPMNLVHNFNTIEEIR